jgi:hypothetical protein
VQVDPVKLLFAPLISPKNAHLEVWSLFIKHLDCYFYDVFFLALAFVAWFGKKGRYLWNPCFSLMSLMANRCYSSVVWFLALTSV